MTEDIRRIRNGRHRQKGLSERYRYIGRGLTGRKGQECVVLVWPQGGGKRSAMVQFADGRRCIVPVRDGYSWVWVGNGRLAHIAAGADTKTFCGRRYTERGRFSFVSEPYACRVCFSEYRRLESARRAAIEDADDEERLWPSAPDCE